MSSLTLVSRDYFAGVVGAMEKAGLKLLAQVFMSTDDFRYHVPVKYARDTRLFLYTPERNCFFILSFNEIEYDEGSSHRYWSIRFDVELKDGGPPDFRGDGERWKPECSGFHHAGWSSIGAKKRTWNLSQSDSYDRADVLSPDELAGNISELLGELDLEPSPFDELQVTSWEPEYCFKGCGNIFWERFRASSETLHGDRRHFWTLVTKPWGSTGLKR